MPGVLVQTVVSKANPVRGLRRAVGEVRREIHNEREAQRGLRADGSLAMQFKRADTKRGRRQGAAAGLAAGVGYDHASGGSNRRKAFRQTANSPAGKSAHEAAWNAKTPAQAGLGGLQFDRLVDRQVNANNRAVRSHDEKQLQTMSKSTAGYLVRRAKMVRKAGKLAPSEAMPKRVVGAVRRGTLTEQPGGPAAFAAGSLATMAFAPGRDGTEAKRRQAGDGISKDWALPVVHHSTHQSRNPLGRFASPDNHFTHDAGKNLTTRQATAVQAKGHGTGGLAPAATRRKAARPANSNSPNGAGYGRRLS